jgi:hypothetical protein
MTDCRVLINGQHLDLSSFDGPTDEELRAAYRRAQQANRAKARVCPAGTGDRARASSIVFAVGTPRLGKYGRNHKW